MDQRLALLKINSNHNNMSICSNNGSTGSPTRAMEIEVIAFREIPLTALSKGTLRKLSHLLNSKKGLRSEEGYERDWRGLASLAKQKSLCDENVASGDDPTQNIIRLWCKHNPRTATFDYLQQFLGILDRWDVSDDIYENLVEDAKIYQTKPQKCLQENSEKNLNINSANLHGDYVHASDSNILTTSDVIRAQKGLPPQMYDAFVLYADTDSNYATEMLTKLEDNPEYNLKLCMKDRDLLAGVQFEHIALTQLIEERCKHLVVIVTEEFLKSPENTFLVNYTQAQQIQHKQRKIVPLIYEDSVHIPRTLRIYTHLCYNPRTGSLFNFWSKLANSIKNVNDTTDITTAHYSTAAATYRIPSNSSADHLQMLPSTDVVIPSISITTPDETEKPQQKERSKLKMSTVRTAELQPSYQTQSLTSITDSSTTSIYNEPKRKWSKKILKKIFSRSNSKLQEA